MIPKYNFQDLNTKPIKESMIIFSGENYSSPELSHEQIKTKQEKRKKYRRTNFLSGKIQINLHISTPLAGSPVNVLNNNFLPFSLLEKINCCKTHQYRTYGY